MFSPTFDRILIQVDRPREYSQRGIILPTKSQEKSSTGIVKAVGPGRWGIDGKRIAVGVAIGDRVMYIKFDGTEFDTDEDAPRHMIVISEPSILGVLS